MVPLGDVPGGPYDSTATAASGDGSIIVGWGDTASGREGFRWTEETGIVGLEFLPGPTSSQANAVSTDGHVIVGGSGGQAFRWTADEGMVALGDFNALDVSADGSIIVGHEDGEVIVWDEAHGMRSLSSMLGLDLSDWTWTDSTGLSADGTTIVGWGYHPDIDANEAWIAVLPEPSTLLLLALGGIIATRRRRHEP